MALCFSPKDLGLNVRTLDCLWTVHGLDFWAVSNSPENKIPKLFSDSPELEYETKFSQTVHAYSLVCIA